MAGLVFLACAVSTALLANGSTSSQTSGRTDFDDEPEIPMEGGPLFRAEDGMFSKESLKCCCDTDLGMEGYRCGYLKPKWMGGCPWGDLGRGQSQTHSAQRDLDTSRCELTGDEDIEAAKRSKERNQCIVSEHVDESIWPPEKYGNYALRKGIAQIPGIGDVYIAIEEIQVVELDLELVLERKSDSTFAFKISGLDGTENANAKLWIKGLNIYLPQSSLDHALAVWSTIENIGANILTFGFAGSNYAKTENCPAGAEFHMSGEFHSDNTGGWDLDPVTEKHFADINIGNGGLLMLLVNTGIKEFGGFDKIFFDIIWPFMDQLIPNKVGTAFQTVPYETGKVRHHMRLKAKCADRKGDTCPGQRLELELHDVVNTSLTLEPVIRKLLEEDFDVPGITDIMVHVLDAYDNNTSAVAGTKGVIQLTSTLDDRGLTVMGGPELELPLHLLQSIVGPDVPLHDVLPAEGTTHVGGKIQVAEGIVTATDVGVTGTPLEVPIGAGDDFLKISANIDVFEIELEATDGEAPLPFNKSSPLTIAPSGLDVALTPKGINVGRSGPLLPLYMELARWFMTDQLMDVAAGLMHPMNNRTAAINEADGTLPKYYQRPFAYMKMPIDLPRLLPNISLDTTLGVDTMQSEGGEMLELVIQTSLTGTLHVGSYVWKGLTESQDVDFGYVHMKQAGYYGTISGGKRPNGKALAILSCGTLWIYGLSGEPFAAPAAVRLDTRHEDTKKLIKKTKFTKTLEMCFLVKQDAGVTSLWGLVGTTDYYFCGQDRETSDFLNAIQLQEIRFNKADKRWPEACTPGKDGQAPTCMGNPDGTWFTKFDALNGSTWFPFRNPPAGPEDVQSPWDAWKQAEQKL